MKEFNKIVSSCYRNSPNVFKARFNKEVLKRTKWKDESEKMQYLRTKNVLDDLKKKKICKQVKAKMLVNRNFQNLN